MGLKEGGHQAYTSSDVLPGGQKIGNYYIHCETIWYLYIQCEVLFDCSGPEITTTMTG